MLSIGALTLKALGLLGLLAVAACGPTLYRNNTTQAEFERDKAQCEYEASAATAGGTGMRHRTVVGAAYDEAMTQGRLALMCMRARGYTEQRPS